MEYILGIDLGTTNSVVSIIRDGVPRTLPVEGDSPILPSVVGLDSQGNLLVGTPARNQSLSAPERTIQSVKRQMGKDVRLKLGEQLLQPHEVSAIILRHLQAMATNHLGQSIRKAVITVPAFFDETQRAATREAGELAGLEVVRIVNEPTAASLTYEPDTSQLEKILVYDLGGGTFDVSIVQIEQGVVEVLSSHGDTQLGGDDFDRLLLEYVARQFQHEHPGIDLLSIPTAKARLLHAVEEAKKRLSFEPYTVIQEAFLGEHEGKPLNVNITLERDEYEALIQPWIEKTIQCVDDALRDAGMVAKHLDRVILVGGSSRTPLVHRTLEERLEKEPELVVEPDLCVSLGAAVQGALISGADVSAVLVDITPHTLGIRTVGEMHGHMSNRCFVPIIRRNTALPASRAHLFYTLYPGQDAVDIEIYQGEDEDIDHNKLVGEFTLEGLDQQAGSDNQILVRFDLNLDGTLTATAVERATALEHRLQIANTITRFREENREQAKQRLRDMFGDDRMETTSDAAVPQPHIDMERHPVEVRSRDLLHRAVARLPQASPEDSSEIRELQEEMEIMLRDQHWEGLSEACGKLEDILFYLESV